MWAVALCAASATRVAGAQTPGTLRVNEAVATLQQWYVQRTGLYAGTGWWNAANAITAVTDAMQVTGERASLPVLEHTFAAAQVVVPKAEQVGDLHEMTGAPGFLNNFYDDEGWWALAWVDAYDLTRESKYLAMAQLIFADMAGGWDGTCGGGIWWSKDRAYKNAIANELFFSVAAHLAARVSGERGAEYAGWAARERAWFEGSGMINREHLVNDGLRIDKGTGACTNNGQTTWTYNQGVLIGALAEDAARTGDKGERQEAERIADAAVKHLTGPDHVLRESCEPDHCGADGEQFKGIFVRNLAALQRAAPKRRYRRFLERNAASVWLRDRGEAVAEGARAENGLGISWAGPYRAADAATQSSALDALVAAAGQR